MSKLLTSKCLKRLKSAKNDTEKFAALLMVTKVLRSDTCDDETRAELFDAVGFGFVRRLLKSNLETEDGNDRSYQQLAVNLLSAFCSDEKLVICPEMQEMLPHLNKILLSYEQHPEDEDDSIIADSYTCYTCIANRNEGRNTLIFHGSVATLCSVISRDLVGREKAVLLLRFLLHKEGHRCWKGNEHGLNELLECCCRRYAEETDDAKFECGRFLTDVVSSCTQEQLDPNRRQWREDVHKTLFGVLRNKLGSKQRDATIPLASALVDLLGVTWILKPDISDDSQRQTHDCRKYLLLLVHLVCIEVRMSLEDKTFIQVRDRSEVLCFCYSLLENIIEYMTSQSSLDLEEKQTSQLFTANVGAFNAIIHFLDDVRSEHEDQTLDVITLASVRALGSWIAEETTALQKEVVELLPFLLKVGRESFELTRHVLHDQQSSGSESAVAVPGTRMPVTNVLKFLVPGLCHLTSEQEALDVFVQEKGLTLLAQYFSHLATVLSSQEEETMGSMMGVCNIFLNIIELKSQLAATDAAVNDVFCYIVHNLHLLDPSRQFVYVFHLSAVGMGIARCKSSQHGRGDMDQCGQFFGTVVTLLKNAHVCSSSQGGQRIERREEYSTHWSDISDLWFLSMQSMAGCVSSIPWISSIIQKSGWIPELLSMLWGARGGSKLDLEVSVAFNSLLSQLVITDGSVKRTVLDQKGLEIARNFNMKELERELQR